MLDMRNARACCVTQSICAVTGREPDDIIVALIVACEKGEIAFVELDGKGSSAVPTEIWTRYLQRLGWTVYWCGSRDRDLVLPENCVCAVEAHAFAIVNGVIHDIGPPSTGYRARDVYAVCVPPSEPSLTGAHSVIVPR